MRRKALRGAVIVFFTAGYSGKKFIFDKAHELGARAPPPPARARPRAPCQPAPLLLLPVPDPPRAPRAAQACARW